MFLLILSFLFCYAISVQKFTFHFLLRPCWRGEGVYHLAGVCRGAQGWKFMSYNHCQELGQQASGLLIGSTRVNIQSEARAASWPNSWPWLQLINFRSSWKPVYEDKSSVAWFVLETRIINEVGSRATDMIREMFFRIRPKIIFPDSDSDPGQILTKFQSF